MPSLIDEVITAAVVQCDCLATVHPVEAKSERIVSRRCAWRLNSVACDGCLYLDPKLPKDAIHFSDEAAPSARLDPPCKPDYLAARSSLFYRARLRAWSRLSISRRAAVPVSMADIPSKPCASAAVAARHILCTAAARGVNARASLRA